MEKVFNQRLLRVVLIISFLLPIITQAGQARYVYDELGRLIRVVNEQGDVAIYNYDSVGNLLSIQRTTSSNLQPVINSITPSTFNRGTQVNVTLDGQYFLSGVLTTNDPDITISNVVVTDDTVTAVFTIALNATTGTFQATLTTHFGSDSIPIEVSQQSAAPTNLTAQEGNQQVILDWDDYTLPNFEGFHVYRGTTSGGPYTRLTSSLITTSYYKDQTVTNNTTYYYVVTATQAGFSESAYSNEAQATPQGGATNVCGTITTNTTWRLTGSPFQVTCDVTIQNNSILTIDPGVEVRFASGTGINIGVSGVGGAGGLSAVGSVAGPILFTSDQPTPAPGNWKGLNFTANTIDASTRLDYAIVEYGGSGTNNANIRLDNAAITIQHSTVRHSSGHGIRLQSVSGLTLNQTTITQNASYGLIQESTVLTVTITSNTFQNNGAYPVRVSARSVGQMSGNTYTGNSPNAIEVIGESVNSSQTWQNPGAPFVLITADININNLAALTLEPGVELRFSTGLGLIVGAPGISNGSGTLSAVGTAALPIVFTSAQTTRAPGDWDGLAFRNTTQSANAQLDHVVVEYGGGSTSNTNIHIDNRVSAARVSAQHGTVRHSSGHGIFLQGGLQGSFIQMVDQVIISQNAGYGLLQEDATVGSVTLTGSTLQNNGSYPVRVRADTVGLLSGNTYGGNNPNAIEVVGQAVTTSQTWQNDGVPYVIITADITIQNGAVLTLESGQEMRFASGIGLNVGVGASTGGLFAVGAAATPIVFTANQISPAPGDWEGLNFTTGTIDASTQLDYVTVEYGGSGTNNANIRIDNAVFPIQHSTVRHSSGRGIRITGNSNPTIQEVEIRQNAGYGVIHEGTGGSLTLTGSTIQNNGSYPVGVRADLVGQLSGNTYGGNNPDAIEVRGQGVTTSQTCRNEGVPYVITTADISMSNGAVLTLEPGVQMRFSTGLGLNMGVGASTGGLFAVGTAAAPIVFTSNQASPAPGDWKGLNFTNSTIDASTQLDYVTVEYGGSGTNNANIILTGATFPIQHSTIRNSSGYGIRATTSSNPSVNFNSITGNPLFGLSNATSTITINAENNWWGSASGPTHASNPGGTGDAVSNFVDFTPWLTSPP